MQVSHYAVHVGHSARSETVEKYRKLPRGKKVTSQDYVDPPKNASVLTYAAMIEDLDTSLAAILDEIEGLGIKDNTYVIFTSDNGGAFRGNRPLRGGKGQLWEGGIRVPTVVIGPGVKQGTICNVPIAGWDIYPTVNDLLGGDSLPAEFDGGSLCDVFEKGDRGTVERGTRELIFHFPWYGKTLPMSAIRDGEYKLVMNLHTMEVQLYNLDRDLGEATDLVDTMPEKTSQLRSRLLEYLDDADAEDLNDMFDARIRELNRYLARERQRPIPDKKAIDRHNHALNEVRQARMATEWR